MKSRRYLPSVLILLLLLVLAPLAPIAVPRAAACTPATPCIALDAPRVIERAVVVALQHAALVAARTAIQSMTQSIVTWINSGFDGSPAFATNLGVNIRQLQDGVANDFLNQLQQNASISSPHLAQAINTVRTGYLLYSSREGIARRLQYTLGQYSNNPDAFLRGDFSNGGFNAWFALGRDCGNDSFCTERTTEEELLRRLDSRTQELLHEFDAGRGFLSWRGDCKNNKTGSVVEGRDLSLSDANDNYDCEIRTPGSVLAGQIDFLASQPQLQLTVATSIDQILGALASQLVSQVIGPGGLLGAGGSSGSSGSGTVATLPSSVAATLSAGFIEEAQGQHTNVISYQSAWTTIRAATLRASQACTNGLTNPATSAEVSRVLAQADAALRKAGTAATALDSIITRARQAQTTTGTSQGGLITQVTNDYQCLLSGGTPSASVCTRASGTPIGAICPVTPAVLPETSELICSASQSQDSGIAVPATLLTRMNQIADDGCN